MIRNYVIAFILLILSNCLGVDDSCLDPDCLRSNEVRFNLINDDGKDLVFDSSYYKISEIEIVDTLGNRQRLYEATVSTNKILVVELNAESLEFDLILKGMKVDRFKVSYVITNERCCGETFWITGVKFNLATKLKDQNIGAIPIVVN